MHMRNVCSVDGCGGVVKGFQLCNKHYLRFKKHGSAEISSGAHAPLDIRFWTKVQKGAANECWLWRGTTMKNGYGRIGEGGRGGKSLSAHRVSCEMHHGPAPFFGAHVIISVTTAHALTLRTCDGIRPLQTSKMRTRRSERQARLSVASIITAQF